MRKRLAIPLLLLSLVSSAAGCLAQQAGVSATSTPLETPAGIAYSPAGELFIAEAKAHRIRKVDVRGNILTVAGTGEQGFSGDGGPATGAQLDSPQSVAVDSQGNLFVADTHNHRVRRIDSKTGIISTVVGDSPGNAPHDGGAATTVRLILPVAVAAGATGELYIADAGADRIFRVDAATGGLTVVAGTGEQGDAGDGGPATQATIDTPSSLAIDASGNLYLADTHNHRVRRVDAFTGQISTVPGTAASLVLPRGLVLGASGELFVSDAGAQRVLRVLLDQSTIEPLAGSGTQAFAGDSGDASAAALDSPAALALSPSGFVTLADSHNERVRQVDGGARIHTIAGLADLQPVDLTLVPDQVLTYGAGSVRATLVTSGIATGTAVLQEILGASTVALQTLPIAGSDVSFSTASLSAGPHRVQLLYSGDALHAPAVSAAAILTISPAVLTAVPDSASMSYGDNLPKLSGAVTGVLPRDAGHVSITFESPASQSSPVGAYPVAVVVTGDAAANYTLETSPAFVTVQPANSLVAIHSAMQDTDSGVATQILVTSSTSGQPGGSVTLLDGGTPVASGIVPPNGSTALNTGTLANGTHVLTAFYSGDGNFKSSTSTAVSVAVGSTSDSGATPSGDFALAVSGPATQTAASGSAVNYAFAVNWTGAPLSSPVTFSASGAPALSTVSFNPGYLPPGGAVTAFTMTVQLPNTAAALLRKPHGTQGAGLLLALLLPACLAGQRRSRTAWKLRLLLCTAPLLLFTDGCGDRVTSPGPNNSNLTETPYPVTVTATTTTAAGSVLQHTQQVTLIVQSAK